jgi:uncharacterized membrane protein
MNNIKISTGTHDYDKIIGPLYKKYVKEDIELLIQPLSFSDTINELVIEINKTINPNIKKNAMNTIKLLLNNKNNYDTLNDINAIDVLRRTWRFIREYSDDSKGFFIEQISDIFTKGSCSQGRTTRIYQFYEFHMGNKDEIYNKCKKLIN